MTGAEKLKEKILSEARLKETTDAEVASREVAEIISEAKKEAEKRKSAILSKAEKDAVAKEKRLISVSELEGRKTILATKQEIIEELFNKSIEKLNLLPVEKYEDILIDMICESAIGSEEVILSQKDASKVSDGFIDKANRKLTSAGKVGALRLSSSDDSRRINGGFLLKSGDIEINNSFESIISTQRDNLESLAVKMLF